MRPAFEKNSHRRIPRRATDAGKRQKVRGLSHRNLIADAYIADKERFVVNNTLIFGSWNAPQ
jgi:hypothetical protein